MANTDFSVLLKAILDKSNVASELEQIQKIVNKYTIDVMPELKDASLRNQMKSISKDIANEFNKTFGTSLTGKDVFKAYENQAKLAEKAIRNEQKLSAEHAKSLYNDILSTAKKINSLKIDKLKLDPNVNVKEWKSLEVEIERFKKKYDSLWTEFWDNPKNQTFFSMEDLQVLNDVSSTYERVKLKLSDTSSIEHSKKVYNELLSTVKELSSLETKQAKVDANTNQWNELSNQIDTVSLKYEKLLNEFWSTDINKDIFSIEDLSKLDDEFIKASNAIELMKSKIKDIQDAKIDKIKLSLDNGHGSSDYANRIKEMENSLIRYGVSTDEVSKKTKNLHTLLDGFKNKDGKLINGDLMLEQADKIEREFESVKISINEAKIAFDKFSQPVSSDKASSLIVKINSFLSKNTNITKEARIELENFVRQLNSGVDLSEWNRFNTSLKRIENEMRVAGRLGKSLKQTLLDGAKSFAQWTLASGSVMDIINAGRSAIQNVKELDDSLVELNKVSDLTKDELADVTEECFKLGDGLAKTGTKVLDSVTSFKRAGYDIEDSMKYAEEALKTTNISENLKDAGQAADSLVNIMKGFQEETPEFASKINDAINKVSNTEAVDFDNLIDGSTRLSAVADQAGMSFEQMLGTLTGAYEVLGNMEKVANGQITIFTRLQAIQMEGEEEVSTVAKLQDKFSNATNGAVNIIDQTTGQLRNVYDILDDLSEVWDTLDKNTKEALAFEAAGTRQKNVFLAMMQNWNGVEDAVESAKNSIGSANEENEAYLDSLSGKLEDFESATQHLSKTLIDSDLLKFFVDFGTGAVKSIDFVIDKMGTLGTLATVGAGIAGAKGLGLTNYVTNHSLRVPFYKVA